MKQSRQRAFRWHKYVVTSLVQIFGVQGTAKQTSASTGMLVCNLSIDLEQTGAGS